MLSQGSQGHCSELFSSNSLRMLLKVLAIIVQEAAKIVQRDLTCLSPGFLHRLHLI